MLTLAISPVVAQVKHQVRKKEQRAAAKKPAYSASRQLAEFKRLAAQADLIFTFPKGFREIKAPDDDYFSFDYAMTIPGEDFEIWFQVKSQKENWASYVKSKSDPHVQLANPDSTYIALANAHASAFTGDKTFFIRTIPPEVLAKYNADAGKSYLLNLRDMPDTRHFKYALLITLQKDHTGILMAVCFTNDKGPEFFKNMNKAANCLKFKS